MVVTRTGRKSDSECIRWNARVWKCATFLIVARVCQSQTLQAGVLYSHLAQYSSCSLLAYFAIFSLCPVSQASCPLWYENRTITEWSPRAESRSYAPVSLFGRRSSLCNNQQTSPFDTSAKLLSVGTRWGYSEHTGDSPAAEGRVGPLKI